MAHGRQEFALVGYSEYLERRPLKFVEPIPPSRICGACGNIPRLMYTLMCGHTLCEPCYESCATPSECVCPLDGEVCDRDDVSSKEYRAEQLLRRKVHCWNEANGCRVVLPASQVTEHVQRDCQHHVTRCPTCSAVVLSHDICAHLKSQCDTLVLHSASLAQQRTDDSENTKFVAFERKVEQQVGKLDAKLAQLSMESVSQNDKLVDVCHNINHLKEALTDHFGTASIQTLDRFDRNQAEIKALLAQEKTIEQRVGELDAKLAQLSFKTDSKSGKLIELCQDINQLAQQFGPASDRNAAEMKALFSEKCEALMTAITTVLGSVPSYHKTHQQVIKGYAALKELALKEGFSRSMSDKVYLQRYLMSWGVIFKKEGDGVYIALRIQLHEGKEDELLDWPFTKEMNLSLIHPKTRQERHVGQKTSTAEDNKINFCRPIGGSNKPVYFPDARFQSSDIERDGYVEEDQLLLRLEVL